MGQVLPREAIEQLRLLGKEACRICSGIRAKTNPHCAHCGFATPTRPLQEGDIIPDRRRGEHASAPPSAPQGSAPVSTVRDSSNAHTATDETEAEVHSTVYSVRSVRISSSIMEEAKQLKRNDTLKRVPICVAGRMCTCMAEALEGCVAGVETWEILARVWTRLLLARVPKRLDKNEQLKRRLHLWERGDFDT